MMSIKDEIERLRQEQENREAVLKGELIKELDTIFPTRVQECEALVKQHLKALQRADCVSHLEELRRSYNLHYDLDAPTNRVSTARINVGMSIESLSDQAKELSNYVVCDPSTFQATIDLTPIYNDWVSRIGHDVRALTQDMNALQLFRGTLRATLKTIHIAETYAILLWHYRPGSASHPEYGGGSPSTWNAIKATVFNKGDNWQLLI